MSPVPLPMPEPRPAAPHYEIRHVYSDGHEGPIEILPIIRPPLDAVTGRRGFIGAGLATSVAAALLLAGCREPNASTIEPSPSPSPIQSPSPASSTSDDDSTGVVIPTTRYEPPPPPEAPPPPGTICTCNKVCVCIPVCQAHRLLDADLTVRRMAEVVLLAMGSSELAYLRWAAGKVLGALKSRIDGFAEAIEAGQQLDPADLSSVARQCGPYLDAEDPVTALMAAQIFCLWTLRGGPGIGADLADRVATALDRGRALRWPDN